MPQIILKERTAHIVRYTFYTKSFIRHFHSSISHQVHPFQRTPVTSYFRVVNIAKFLRTAFLWGTTRSSRFQMFLKISVLKGFANFTEKHLRWSAFIKSLQVEGLKLY